MEGESIHGDIVTATILIGKSNLRGSFKASQYRDSSSQSESEGKGVKQSETS